MNRQPPRDGWSSNLGQEPVPGRNKLPGDHIQSRTRLLANLEAPGCSTTRGEAENVDGLAQVAASMGRATDSPTGIGDRRTERMALTPPWGGLTYMVPV